MLLLLPYELKEEKWNYFIWDLAGTFAWTLIWESPFCVPFSSNMLKFKDRDIYWKQTVLVQSDNFLYNVILIEPFFKSIQHEDFLETSLLMHHENNTYKWIHGCVAVTISALQEKTLNQLAFARSIHELCTSISLFQILNSELITWLVKCWLTWLVSLEYKVKRCLPCSHHYYTING